MTASTPTPSRAERRRLNLRCATCAWWQMTSSPTDFGRKGVCHRHAPSPTFPETIETDWCAEHRDDD